jgi:hypothetical protein
MCCLFRRTTQLAGKGEDYSSPSPLSPGGPFPLFTGVPLSGTGRPHHQSPKRGVTSPPPQGGTHTSLQNNKCSWPRAGSFLLNSTRRQTAGPVRQSLGECFLASCPLPEKLGRPRVGCRTGANCPHGFAATDLLTTDPPLTAGTATPGELPSPSVCTRRVHTRRRVARAVSSGTYGPGVSRRCLERRGTFAGQCCRPL